MSDQWGAMPTNQDHSEYIRSFMQWLAENLRLWLAESFLWSLLDLLFLSSEKLVSSEQSEKEATIIKSVYISHLYGASVSMLFTLH